MANENTPDAPRPGSPASPEPDAWVTMPRPRQAPPEGEGEAASLFARPAENPWGQPSAQEPTTPIPSTPTTPYPVPEVQPYPSGPASPYGAQPGEGAPQPGQQPWHQAPPPQPWEQAAAPQPWDQAPQPQPWGQDAAAHHPQTWQGQGQGHPGQPPWASGLRDANPLSALFDFGFTKFATPGLVKIVYTLFVVAAIGSWVLWVLAAFVGGSFGAGAASGLVVLLFGWIPALLSIAFTRFILEGIVALIRIHDRVSEIAERLKDAPDA